MNTLIKGISIFILLLVGTAGAGETFNATHDFGSDGLLWSYKPQKWTDNSSVDWFHSLTGFQSTNSVTTASLPLQMPIKQNYGLSNSSQQVAIVTGHSGVLAHSQSERFNITTDGTTDFSSKKFTHSSFHRGRKHSGSYYNPDNTINETLPDDRISKDYCPPKIPPATVPAPGAIVMAGIGTLIVGLLRNRRILDK